MTKHPITALVLLGLLAFAPSVAEAQPHDSDVRLMLETDFFRWIRVKPDDLDDVNRLLLGPYGPASVWALTSVASAGLGYAITRDVVINAAFGVAWASNPDTDGHSLAMRVVPDVDILLKGGRGARPYVTLGVPIAIAKQDWAVGVADLGTSKSRSAGPQVGLGVMAGPFHAELTFAALFGKGPPNEDRSIRELSVGLSMGASLWL